MTKKKEIYVTLTTTKEEISTTTCTELLTKTVTQGEILQIYLYAYKLMDTQAPSTVTQTKTQEEYQTVYVTKKEELTKTITLGKIL